MEIMEDRAIVALFWRRDEDALRQSAGKYSRACLAVARNILGEEDAEECVNDTWLRAWEGIPPAKPERLGSFLMRITRNLALDRRRSQSAGKRRGAMPDACLEELEACVGTGEDPMDGVLLRDALERFLRTLDERPREIFLYRYWYFLGYPEIARRCGTTGAACKMSLSRTRTKLKTFLKSEGFDV